MWADWDQDAAGMRWDLAWMGLGSDQDGFRMGLGQDQVGIRIRVNGDRDALGWAWMGLGCIGMGLDEDRDATRIRSHVDATVGDEVEDGGRGAHSHFRGEGSRGVAAPSPHSLPQVANAIAQAWETATWPGDSGSHVDATMGDDEDEEEGSPPTLLFESLQDWERELQRLGAVGWRVSAVNERFDMAPR